jgi:hypothetical protein
MDTGASVRPMGRIEVVIGEGGAQTYRFAWALPA